MLRPWKGLLFVLVLVDLSTANETASSRQRFDANAPDWMKNVANIEVPAIKIEQGRARHYKEYCSGTLLTSSNTLPTRFVISAWHCVEHYQDLSRDLEVHFPHSPSTQQSVYTARLIDSGGSIYHDWALLELKQGPSTVQLKGLSLSETDISKPAVAAGFALGLPDGRKRLSFDDSCLASGKTEWVRCSTSKGASGGPIVQIHEAIPSIVGIISQGDSRDFTISYPSAKLPQRWKNTFQAQLL